MSSSLEEDVWNHMQARFYGPIDECPSPQTPPETIVKEWSEFIMYRLTKWGDSADDENEEHVFGPTRDLEKDSENGGEPVLL
jgi:hypothetical protein